MKKTKESKNKDLGEAEHSLYKAVAKIRDAQEAQQFLEDLCTPAELQAMADRWQVVEPLENQKPYREIYDETGVSITTIGRVARCLNFGTGGYHLIYKRTKKDDNKTTKTQHRTSEKGPP